MENRDIFSSQRKLNVPFAYHRTNVARESGERGLEICERGQRVSVFLPNRRWNAALCERVLPSIGRFPANLRPCRVNGLESLEGLYVYDRAFTGQGFFPSVGRLYPEICRVSQTNTLRLLSSCALVARWRRARAVPGAPFTGVDPSARWISLIVSRRFVPSNDRCILIRSPPLCPYDQPWVVRYLIKLIKRIETYWNLDRRKMARGIPRLFLRYVLRYFRNILEWVVWFV